ncbi:hypothetical protein P691DRAFT_793978 [Macrolepiota fuliginosa MF-IS2]|uniref:VTT domain-containing protein n=1 Tax=Macrolepiota fuliginosa MF-IS2 TaxID=1400762 RepID=A0A9P5XC94_9AGAR|nr:hypothetical protein P691DRAFT_793978 [Macrolepiota fuliginosa MF-IS2]
MIFVVASRVLQWLHLNPEHGLSWSNPSTPRSSSDDFILPLSASAQKTSFGNVTSEKPPSPVHHFPSVHFPIVVVICLLPISTALVFYCMSTLPISLSWPQTIADVAQLGRELAAYTQSGTWPLLHVMGVMAISAIWKHAWSIPGSVIWNVLAGALFSPALATLFLTILTTIGSACASLLATPLAPFLTYFFPRALDVTRAALGGDSEVDQGSVSTDTSNKNKSSAWVRLSVLRLIGVVPWSGINIACGVCGVALGDCMLGTFIGCLPWTAVTCQIGDILQTVASSPSPTAESISSLLMSPRIILKLVFLSFLSLAPILGRDRLRTMIHPSVTSVAEPDDERSPRRNWVRDWRTKIRMASKTRSRDRTASVELNVLIQEKRALEQLPS